MKFLENKRTVAILQAFLVTLLWSSSWVIIKIALKDLQPLTFAGLRLVLAFFCLLPFTIRKGISFQLKALDRSAWLEIILLGVIYYAVTPGGQNLGLKFLPANTLSLILSFTVVVVAFLGKLLLNERPSLQQWLGMVIFLLGTGVYFWKGTSSPISTLGIIIGLITMLANSFSALLGRKINRAGTISPSLLTTLSMGIGAFILLGVGLVVEGFPKLTWLHWVFIVWLAAVNTAFAYQLWNKSLTILPAMDSVLINNSMLAQVSILAWVFLGESLSVQQIIGLTIAMAGVIIVQVFPLPKRRSV